MAKPMTKIDQPPARRRSIADEIADLNELPQLAEFDPDQRQR